jgi:hypothetical protein
LAKPGVSIRLILVFCHSAKARLEESVCLPGDFLLVEIGDGGAVVDLCRDG